ADPGDVIGVADAAARMARDRDQARTMGARGRDYCLEHFDREACIDRYDRIVHDLASTRSRLP
ncbi:MAG: glycosyltransferase family 4 protein, partial [Deltaproteobacteria bacterium]|nr:glycosyltransferase family 4 protein [Deltaproteobacteria bacterium]